MRVYHPALALAWHYGLPTLVLRCAFYGPVCCLGTMTWGKQNTEQEAHEQLRCGTNLHDM